MDPLTRRVNRQAIDPAMWLLPAKFDSPQARVLMLAIGLQESRLAHRWQIVDPARPDVRGPARGLWQFERGGGVAGVLSHPASKPHALVVCKAQGVTPESRRVWSAMADDDVLAAAFARLLLWTEPKPLPAVGKGAEAWEYYLRTWRPGKPHPSTWSGLYAKAQAVVEGSA